MLKRLYIDNYKCFSNFEYRPGQVELLVGANGSGKSTLFSALSSLRSLSAGASAQEVFAQTCTRWDTRGLQTLEVEVELAAGDGPVIYRLEVEDTGDGRGSRVCREVVEQAGQLRYRYEGGEAVMGDPDSTHMEWRADDARSPLMLLAALGQPDPAEPEPVIALCEWMSQIQVLRLAPSQMCSESRGEASSLESSGANYGSWLRSLLQERPSVRDGLKASLSELWPGFVDIRFERVGTRAWALKVEVAAEARGRPWSYELEELSDGERALLVMYTLYHAMLAESPGRLLCIDEPAAHLSLREVQPLIAACYDDFEEADQQLLIASHHPEVINFLAPNKAVVLQRRAGGPARLEPFPIDGVGMRTPAEVVAEGLLDE